MNTQFRLFSCLFICLLAAGGLIGQSEGGRIGNGKAIEIDPLLSPSGAELFFTRPDHNNNQGRDNAPDIWLRKRDAQGNWNRALNPGSPINSMKADRALNFSPDGERLAVLRTGSRREIEILQRNGRNWKHLARWQVPGSVENTEDLTFNLTTGALVYGVKETTGNQDLYMVRAREKGEWSSPVRLAALGSPVDESRPYFSSDGRTLFFFRESAGWFRQLDRGLAPEVTDINIRSQQITLGLDAAARLNPAVISLPGQGGELHQLLVDNDQYPPVGRVVDVAPDRLPLALSNGIILTAIPGIPGNASMYLRADERPVDGSELADLGIVGAPVGGAQSEAGTKTAKTTEGRIDEFSRRIQRYEARLEGLAEERYEILENASITDPYAGLDIESSRDSLPDASKTRAQNQEKFDELAEMKRRFVEQQEGRQRIKDGGRSPYAPEPRAAVKSRTDKDKSRKPTSLSSAGGSKEPEDLAEIRARQHQDSLDWAAGTSRSFTAKSPRGDANWERQLREDLPRTNPAAAAAVTQIDAAYQSQLSELEALKAELAHLRNQQQANAPVRTPAPANYATPGYSPPPAEADNNDRNWARRGAEYPPSSSQGYQSQAPNSRYAPAKRPRRATAPTRSGSAPTVLPITFISNTAYLNGPGFDGMDELFAIIQAERGPVEIRVHAPFEMDRRSAQLLSEDRAKTIHDELVEMGIAPRHFTVLGFGNNQTGKGGERVELY